MLRKIYALLFTVWASYSAVAQSGAIKGRALDAANNEPLPFASVVVELNGAQAGGAQTDFDGNFTIKPLSPGKYTLKATYVGYQSVEITGIVVSSDKITFKDVLMAKNTQNLKEVKIEAYKVPIIDKGNPSTQTTVTQEEIAAAPQRDINSIASTTAGVFQKDEGDALNIRGQRSSGTEYFIDGVKVRGSAGLPQQGIEQITVVTGGVPAQYGDATGGIINITTRGPSRNFFGGLELTTSELFDKYGYNLGGFNVSGPIVSKKEADGSKTPLLGFFISGEFQSDKVPNPSAVGFYKVNDDVLNEIKTSPLQFNANGTGLEEKSEYVSDADMSETKIFQNVKSQTFRFSGKLDIQPAKQVTISVGGSVDYNKRHDYNYNYALFNYENNSQTTDLTWRTFLRLTHRLSNPNASQDKSASVVKNAYYTIQADYEKFHSVNEDDSHGKDFWNYGYVGQFNPSYDSSFTYTPVDTTGDGIPDIIVNDEGAVHLNYLNYGFTGGTTNPEYTAYTQSVYDLTGPFQSPTELQNTTYGFLNGQRRTDATACYSMWYNPGRQFNGYSVTDNGQFRVSVSGSFDLKNHAIQLGFEYEQRKDAFWGLNPLGLWTSARGLQNLQNGYGQAFYNATGDTFTAPWVYVPDSITIGTTKYKQTGFYENIRNQLGLPMNSYIDIDSYDPSTFSLDLFTPDELMNILGSTNAGLFYYGYDWKGNKSSENPSFNDYYNKLDPNGNYALRPVAPFQPIYMAGYIQDKFAINDLIFNVGVRIDRYDANQKVLKDKYSLYQTKTAGEVDFAHPDNIGDDFVVYVSDVKNPSADEIVGYRDGDDWYDAKGTLITDPGILAKQTTSGYVAPYLVNPADDIRKFDFNTNTSFEDYTPQITVMPRIAFSFPISDQALFFAHYDVLTQRPTDAWRNNPSDYLDWPQGGGTFSNPNLKPQRTTDYELGFKQSLSRSSAISISAFYRELRDMVQIRRINYAYPITYSTYDNYDFGTVQGFSLTYDMRRTGNIRLSASYTLQFASGTGSNAGSNAELVNNGQPNLRTLAPLDFDQRHTIVASIDYRYGSGSDYNGPMWFNTQFLSNFGLNLVLRAGSGTPYSAIADVRTEVDNIGLQQTGTGALQGDVNGSRLPWQFRADLKIDKDFALKSSKKEGGRDLTFNVYLQFLNLFNTLNVVNVYRATGNPDDDGFLASPQSTAVVNSATDPDAYVDLYNVKQNNPSNYSYPRRVRLGIQFGF